MLDDLLGSLDDPVEPAPAPTPQWSSKEDEAAAALDELDFLDDL